MKKIIGTNTVGYPEIRNFAGLQFNKYKVLKIQNINKLWAHIYFKATKKTHQYYWNTYRDLNLRNDISIFHFFNGISTGSTPWITTFETYIPRWGNRRVENGFKLMMKDSCKKIIAISECTANIQRNFIGNNSNLLDSIENKMMVMHPSQVLHARDTHRNTNNEYVTFILVGNQIFSKGGREVIDVLSKFFRRGYPVRLNLVSNLSTDNYASFTGKSDLFSIKELISRNREFIRFFENIPNRAVIDLMMSSDVALAATYAETYGYAILEAQACGCPVISTDIRAIPEINDNKSGWIIKVPKDRFGNGLLGTDKLREDFSESIRSGLETIVQNILDNPQEIKLKAAKSIERIKKNHSPRDRIKVLENLYDKILEANC